LLSQNIREFGALMVMHEHLDGQINLMHHYQGVKRGRSPLVWRIGVSFIGIGNYLYPLF